MLDYAQVEDQIRKLWLQLLQEQQKLSVRLVYVDLPFLPSDE